MHIEESEMKQGLQYMGCIAQLVVDEAGPGGGFAESDKYRIFVSPDGGITWQSSYVYMSTYNMAVDDCIYRKDKAKDTASFACIASDYSRPLIIEVERLTSDAITSIDIRPKSFAIENTISYMKENIITFEISRSHKISVEFNGDLSHKLFIFADMLEINPPSEEDDPDCYYISPRGSLSDRVDIDAAWNSGKSIIYFRKGVHYINEDTSIPEGRTLYLAQGAYVFGSFKNNDRNAQIDNIRITGRGILDSFNGRNSQIWLHGDNIMIDGVILLHKYKGMDTPSDGSVSVSAVWMKGGSEHPNIVRNVKVIDWLHAGGIFAYNGKVIIDDCFIFTNDDCIDLSFPRDICVTNCVTWNYYNGSALECSWNSYTKDHNAVARDIHVIHWDSLYDDPGINGDIRTGARLGVIFASHDSAVILRNFTIENLTVESMEGATNKRFIALNVLNNVYDPEGYNDTHEFGGFDKVTLRNIRIDCDTENNQIMGYDDGYGKISEVLIDNLMIQGKNVTNAEDARLDIRHADVNFVKL